MWYVQRFLRLHSLEPTPARRREVFSKAFAVARRSFSKGQPMDCMEMLKRPLNARVAEVPPRPPPLDFACLLSARGQGIRRWAWRLSTIFGLSAI